jgi:hypothetical protein
MRQIPGGPFNRLIRIGNHNQDAVFEFQAGQKFHHAFGFWFGQGNLIDNGQVSVALLVGEGGT